MMVLLVTVVVSQNSAPGTLVLDCTGTTAEQTGFSYGCLQLYTPRKLCGSQCARAELHHRTVQSVSNTTVVGVSIVASTTTTTVVISIVELSIIELY